MKSLKIFFLTALVAVASMFTACTEDHNWSAGEQEQGAQVYFVADAVTTVNVEAETSSFEVTVMRGNTEEAVSVPIKATVTAAKVDEDAEPIDYAALFTIPAKVSFGAGKDSAKLNVTFDRAALEDGQTYTIVFSVNDASAVTSYGYSSQSWTLVVPEPLVLLGTGYWVDDIVGPLFGLNVTTYPVEVYENLKTPGYIYLKDLYTNAFKQTLIDEFGIAEESIPTWPDSYFAINIADPTAVEVPGQYTGLDIGYGDMAIWSLSTGTLENGIISFPTKGLAIQDNDGAYYANTSGLTKLYMPGTPMTDFSLELAYGGFRVAEDNETIYPIARVAYGEDVAEIQYAFIAGDITKDAEALVAALAGIEDGSVVSNKVAVTSPGKDEEGEPILEMTIESVEGAEAGAYTVIAIPYSAEGEAQYGDLAFTSFYVQGVGAGELPEVEFEMYTMSLEDLEEATEDSDFVAEAKSYGLDSSNSVGVILAGVNIKSANIMVTLSSNIEPICEKFGSVEDYITYLTANGYDLSYDLKYIDAWGWDYNIFGGNYAPETNYTMFALVENTYGNAQLFSSSFTTAAEDYLSAKKGGANLRPAVKMDVPLHKQFTSIKPISTISMK